MSYNVMKRLMKIKIGICFALLSALCACSTTRDAVRTDTVTVVEQRHEVQTHIETAWLHDTVTVTVERFDTAQRLTERVSIERGSKQRREARDSADRRDTVYVERVVHEQQQSERVAVAEPWPWTRWAWAACGIAGIVAALWLAKRWGDSWTDIY